MPLYEYRCDACNHEFEALQKISDEPLVHCPACEAPELRKLVSAAGFRLKGQGWYETDFKTGSKRNLAENGGAADSAKKPEAAACGTGCGCH
ncbi:zinc ribbon domain-containing protein [Methylophaga sp.]|uniref:FmdB family zinc ribbon protein n=1 Tax=Methylophaga sp. TaxID=2024840 RepID=UPI001400CC0B|nr:zinc ribbon domain-containing protein [Methylophaga sp.]MTI63659.1 zinc ribbon domain-containing protein [Methylophaga sp.]